MALSKAIFPFLIFQDKIRISDIVFLRAWTNVEAKKLYNPVTSLLHRREEGQLESDWQGMKTVAELRRERGLSIPVNTDSLYKPIERQPQKFAPLKIPRSLEAALPFRSKSKDMKKRKTKTLEAKRQVVLEPEEKKIYTLMQRVTAIKNAKEKARKEKANERRQLSLKRKAKEMESLEEYRKTQKKKHYRNMGQQEAKAAKMKEKAAYE